MTKQYTMSEIDALTPDVSAIVENIGMQLLGGLHKGVADTKIYDLDGHSLKVVFSDSLEMNFKSEDIKILPTRAAVWIPGIPPYIVTLTEEEKNSSEICEETLRIVTQRVIKLIKLGAVRTTMFSIGIRDNIISDLDSGNFQNVSKRFKGMVNGEFSDKGYVCRLFSDEGKLLKEKYVLDELTDPSELEANFKFNKRALGDLFFDYITEGLAFTGHYPDYKHRILTKANF